MIGQKFTYKETQMPKDMRESVLDEIRKVIEKNQSTM